MLVSLTNTPVHMWLVVLPRTELIINCDIIIMPLQGVAFLFHSVGFCFVQFYPIRMLRFL